MLRGVLQNLSDDSLLKFHAEMSLDYAKGLAELKTMKEILAEVSAESDKRRNKK